MLLYLGQRVFADAETRILRRLSWIIWLYLYPVMGMLIRHTEERQTEKEEKEWRWKQRLKWPQAKNAKDCWQLPKAGREACGRFPPRIYDTLISECLASQTVGGKNLQVLRHQVLAICYMLEEVIQRMWLLMAYKQDQAIGFTLTPPLSLEGNLAAGSVLVGISGTQP